MVVFATANKAYYQSRSLKLRASPTFDMDLALIKVAKNRNPFILEGELYFLDYLGKEHRTGAQAAKVNVEAGFGGVQVQTRYGIFYAIYKDDRDLRDNSYAVRILSGESLATELALLNHQFVMVPTARTQREKLALSQTQQSEGREGEVWFRSDLPYRAGKTTDDTIVRTKYLIELNAIVTGLTPTTAQDRPFGAIEVSDMNGKPIGAIGTGFTKVDALKIWTRFQSGKQLIIPIVTQGFTENGQVMHGRLSEEFE
jgi:bifunctional non-homologous end joining protein LigD